MQRVTLLYSAVRANPMHSQPRPCPGPDHVRSAPREADAAWRFQPVRNDELERCSRAPLHALRNPASVPFGVKVFHKIGDSSRRKRLEALIPPVFSGIQNALPIYHSAHVSRTMVPKNIGGLLWRTIQRVLNDSHGGEQVRQFGGGDAFKKVPSLPAGALIQIRKALFAAGVTVRIAWRASPLETLRLTKPSSSNFRRMRLR